MATNIHHTLRSGGSTVLDSALFRDAFGTQPAPGMLSFARPGATLALDFPNRGAASLRLFTDLDAIVAQAGGALYPAKDARMPASLFRAGFPAWEAFSAFIDPRFSSSFWRRVNP